MNTRDHRTLQAIFAPPVRANIVWTDVEHLLRACGAEITEGRGSRVRISLNEDSVEDYLDFCAERGEEPEQPFSGRLTVQLSPEQHRNIILAAEKAGKEVNTWVTDVLTQTTA